jgi:hypothetical protein
MLAAFVPGWLLGWKIGSLYSNDNRELPVGVAYHRQNCQNLSLRRYCERVLFSDGKFCWEWSAGHDWGGYPDEGEA